MAFLRFGTRSLFRTTLPSPIRLNKSPTASISKTLCSSFINFHCFNQTGISPVDWRRASFDARSPVDSLIEEQFPLGDAVSVAEVGRHRQFLWCARDGEQLETGLVREAVGLALVHVLRGPDEVFPTVRAAARSGHDVIETAFVRVQQHAGVLAAIAVALANVLRAELRPLLRHARVVDRHDDSRHADRPARGAYKRVVLADWQRDPLVPFHRA